MHPPLDVPNCAPKFVDVLERDALFEDRRLEHGRLRAGIT